MDTPEPTIVDWPSLLFALLIDSLLVWAPAVSLFFLAPGTLAPGQQLPLATGLILGASATNWALYARGTSLGSYLGGFQLRTRRRQPPGLVKGLILALVTFASIFALAAVAAASAIPGNNASGPLGRPDSYPLFGERIHRRRLLEAADDYWERWSE